MSGGGPGIEGLGRVLPAAVMTAADLAAASGIPARVIRDKFGLRQKHVAEPGQSASDLATEAARRALADAGCEARELDAVVYFGSPHKDYGVWLAAPRIQALLGAERAFAYEVAGVSAGLPFALEAARGLFATRPDAGRVLIAAASTESQLLDYRDHASRFMFNFGDGAAAAVLARGAGRGRVLASAFHTDGRFAEFVRVRAGGSRVPVSHASVAAGMHAFEVADPARMKDMLDPVTLDNFTRVGREALDRSGLAGIDRLLPLHAKRSLFTALCDAFGVAETRAVYLEDTGHISAVDPLLALARLDAAGDLRPGERILLLTAGTGYTWAATALRWGA